MTSGERIKILRILNGFTQQTLAEVADVSRASVMLWEKDKQPTRRTALALAMLFEVSVEYLLEGINPPDYALWKPIVPGHPKHLQDLAIDMNHGISAIFSEIGIDFSAKGQTSENQFFWICGNSPESNEWRLNYLFTCDKSLEPLLSSSIRASVASSIDLGMILLYDGWGAFVGAIAENLQEHYEHYPDCSKLYDRLGGLEGEGDDDFLLGGLLKRFGREIAKNRGNIMDEDLDTMANYLAKEVSRHSGFTNIKCSASKLIRASIKQVKTSWNK